MSGPHKDKVINSSKDVLRKKIDQLDSIFSSQEPISIFSNIYKNNIWGGKGYYSGFGSHDKAAVQGYIKAVRDYLRTTSIGEKTAVDLGCGDFNIGGGIYSFFDQYTAADLVPGLIERNKKKFVGKNLEFINLDITCDPLPIARVAFLREVMQHMSNEDISSLLPKLARYEYVIITEVVPVGPFTPNLDQITGPFSRLVRDPPSGVVLEEKPFSIRYSDRQVLFESPHRSGRRVTIAYKNMFCA